MIQKNPKLLQAGVFHFLTKNKNKNKNKHKHYIIYNNKSKIYKNKEYLTSFRSFCILYN